MLSPLNIFPARVSWLATSAGAAAAAAAAPYVASKEASIYCLINCVTQLLSGRDAAGDQRALDTAMSLPPLVLQALAHALDYLKAFSLETVLRVGAAFQPLHSVHEMSLSPNTLWYLPDAAVHPAWQQ